VRLVRAFLKWWHKSKLIAGPSFGEYFAPLTRKAASRNKAKQTRKDISAEDLRSEATPGAIDVSYCGRREYRQFANTSQRDLDRLSSWSAYPACGLTVVVLPTD
jgi:hypothetical protein